MKIILTSSATRGTSPSFLKVPDWSMVFLKSKPSILLVPFFLCLLCSSLVSRHGAVQREGSKEESTCKKKGRTFLSLGARIESKLLTPGLLRVGTSEEKKNKKKLSISRVEASKGEQNFRGHSVGPHMAPRSHQVFHPLPRGPVDD